MNRIILIGLGFFAVIGLLLTMALSKKKSGFEDSRDMMEPVATTATEEVSRKIYTLFVENQMRKESYKEFLKNLEKEGIKSPKIDLKFYLEARKSYRNRHLTRAWIINRLGV